MADAVERYAAAAAAIGAAAARDYPRLWAAEAIPPDLWSAMADAGLLGLSTAERYGGAGLSTGAIARIGRAFVRASGVQGLVTAWQAHNLMADWVFGHFASEGQRQAWSPRIAAQQLKGRGISISIWALASKRVRKPPACTITVVCGGYWLNKLFSQARLDFED